MKYVTPSLPNRIGHLALEVDCFLKERALAGDESPVTLVLPEVTANDALRAMWAKILPVITPEQATGCEIEGLHRYAATVTETGAAFDVYARWGNRTGRNWLWAERPSQVQQSTFGWVCVHIREGGYSPSDEHCHNYRNAGIAAFVPAMKWLAAQGLHVYRMGDPTMAPIPEVIPGVTDYAHCDWRTPEADLYLLQGCRFFLGSSSGLGALASVFGRAVATVNAAPLDTVYGLGPNDRSIAKRFIRRGWTIPWDTLLASPIGSARYTAIYQQHGVWCEENSPDDILALAREMADGAPDDDGGLQRRFKELFRPGHYSYGSCALIGSAWLAANAVLLGHG